MPLTRVELLEAAISEIQKMCGINAIRPLSSLPNADESVVSTGFPHLDEKLGIGGIPRSHMTSLWGAGTSGTTELAFQIIANAQKLGDVAVFVDQLETFDADDAVDYGVDLDRVLLVNPPDWQHAFEIIRDAIAQPTTGIIVLDAGSEDTSIHEYLPVLSTMLDEINFVLHKSQWVLLLLMPLGKIPFVDYAVTLRLIVRCVAWYWQYDDIVGGKVELTIAKNRFHPSGQVTTVDIEFEW